MVCEAEIETYEARSMVPPNEAANQARPLCGASGDHGYGVIFFGL